MTTVLLADDQALIRAGFRALLDAEEDLEVVGEASTGQTALAQARALRPDVVLMDIRMPDGDGIEAATALLADPGLTATKVIMLTTFELDDYILDSVRAGASGFLVKDTEPEELLRAVRAVARGDALLSPSVTRRLLARLAAARPAAPRPAADIQALTGREREVLALVGRGLNNAGIAARLFITPLTAKTHVSRIMGKLDARDRSQLVVLAYESGIVTAGSAQDDGPGR
ncbi:response regulator transcription factor [Arthrobacter sp.]|uniref:response regulator transcription factor n=1 Tax=Arthrobacter sp. TaxID=1667 RepID=UPI003A8D5582